MLEVETYTSGVSKETAFLTYLQNNKDSSQISTFPKLGSVGTGVGQSIMNGKQIPHAAIRPTPNRVMSPSSLLNFNQKQMIHENQIKDVEEEAPLSSENNLLSPESVVRFNCGSSVYQTQTLYKEIDKNEKPSSPGKTFEWNKSLSSNLELNELSLNRKQIQLKNMSPAKNISVKTSNKNLNIRYKVDTNGEILVKKSSNTPSTF